MVIRSETDKLLRNLAIFAIIVSALSLWSICHAGEVTFSWDASSGQVDGYRIYNGAAMGGPYPDMMGEINGTTLMQTLILNETQEYYLVCRAFNKYGESGNSNEIHWLHELPGDPGSFDWMMKKISAFLDMLGVRNMRVELMIDR